MRKLGILLIALLMSSAAFAKTKKTEEHFSCRVPPTKYDHEPTRKYKVVRWDVPESMTNPGRNLIVLPTWAHGKRAACFLRHEKGHVNGWGHGHEGLRHVRY